MPTNPQPPSKTRRPQPVSRRGITARILAMPRFVRMCVVFAGVMAMAFGLQQVTSTLYVRFFTDGSAMDVIAWVIAGACLLMYVAGYVYIVGMPDETPPAGTPQKIYLLLTAVLVVVSVGWIISRTAEALIE